MSFEKSTINFTVLRTAKPIDPSFEESILEEGYMKTNPTVGGPVLDFSSGVSLASLARDATIDDFKLGALAYFAIRKRELKIDAGTLKEHVERMIHDEIARTGGITSKQKKQFKEDAQDVLEDTAQARVSGTRLEISPDRRALYVEATSASKLTDVIDMLISGVPLGSYGRVDVYGPEMAYVMTAPDEDDSPIRIGNMETSDGLGEDFLTWAFMASESDQMAGDGVEISLPGVIELADCREAATGPKVVMLKEGQPCWGMPVVSCLKNGKKVVSADFMLGFDGFAVEVNIDSDFAFRKFKAVSLEPNGDLVGDFTDRITAIEIFLIHFQKLFARFLVTVEHNEQLINSWIESKEEFWRSRELSDRVNESLDS
jgi:hypothetical protein